MGDVGTAEAENAARRHLILAELFGVHPRSIVDELVVSANVHLYVLGERLEEMLDSAEHDGESKSIEQVCLK
jgi:hypothetical protein